MTYTHIFTHMHIHVYHRKFRIGRLSWVPKKNAMCLSLPNRSSRKKEVNCLRLLFCATMHQSKVQLKHEIPPGLSPAAQTVAVHCQRLPYAVAIFTWEDKPGETRAQSRPLTLEERAASTPHHCLQTAKVSLRRLFQKKTVKRLCPPTRR